MGAPKSPQFCERFWLLDFGSTGGLGFLELRASRALGFGVLSFLVEKVTFNLLGFVLSLYNPYILIL